MYIGILSGIHNPNNAITKKTYPERANIRQCLFWGVRNSQTMRETGRSKLKEKNVSQDSPTSIQLLLLGIRADPRVCDQNQIYAYSTVANIYTLPTNKN